MYLTFVICTSRKLVIDIRQVFCIQTDPLSHKYYTTAVLSYK